VWGKTHFLRQFFLLYYYMTPLVGLPESSGGRINNFPMSIYFHRGSPCSYFAIGNEQQAREISGSHGGEYEYDSLLGVQRRVVSFK
jgi:hypothetical protein